MTKPKMKLVRINDKTQIEVRAKIPNEVAKANFLEKLNHKPNATGGFQKGHKTFGKNAVRDTSRRDLVFTGDNTLRNN